MKKSLIFFVFIMLFNITFLSALLQEPYWYQKNEYFKAIYGNDIYIGYGYSENTGELALSLSVAEARALDNLSRILTLRDIEIEKVKLEKVVKHSREVYIENNKVGIENYYETRNDKKIIIGAKKIKQYISFDGSVFVAYIISKSNVNKSIKKSKVKENKKANVFTFYRENTTSITTKLSKKYQSESEMFIRANEFETSIENKNNKSSNQYFDIPVWFNNIDVYAGYDSDIIIGFGTAAEEDSNTSLKYAENYALASISNQIEVLVSLDHREIFKLALNYGDDDGDHFNESFEIFLEIDSRNEIRNAKKVEEYISPSGRVYVAYIFNPYID